MAEARDYTLSGPASRTTTIDGETSSGKARVKWWAPKIGSSELARLREPTDWPASGDFLLWAALTLGTGALAIASWGTWWAIPAFLLYGTIYSSSDARWHELSHGTAFKSPKLTRFWHEISSFMTVREVYLWRYSHTRHHTHTIIVGHDPEIQVTRPADLLKIALDFFHVFGGAAEIRRILRHAFKGLGPDEADFVPKRARARLIRSSRLYVTIWGTVLLVSLICWSPLPALMVVTPRFYGGWLHQLLGLTQHGGLAENVSDHRLNTRTVYVNPVFRFLYMNMNYHLEHHVSPTVPYHALPAFHEAIKDQCPPAYPSVWAVYREMLPTLWRQAWGEPDYAINRPLPA